MSTPKQIITDQATIIMLTYNRLEFTRQALRSLFETTTYPFSLVIIDNASTDGTVDFLRSFLEQKKSEGGYFNGYTLQVNVQNQGVSGGRNQGLLLADGEWIVVMDNDLVLPQGWLNESIEVLQANPTYGICGVNFEGTQYPLLSKNGKEFQYKQKGNIGGGCMVYHHSLHEALGFYNTQYGLYGEEDADFCMRARFKGYELAYIREDGVHIGEDKDQKTEYRVFKDIRRRKNMLRYRINSYLYKLSLKSLYIPYGTSKESSLTKNPFALRISKLLRATQTQGVMSLLSVLIQMITMRMIQKFRDAWYERRERDPIPQHTLLPEIHEPVTILIPFRDKKMLLEKCVESILAKTTHKHYKILLIDNQSSEPEMLEYLEHLSTNPVIEIIHYDQPFNYSSLHNWAMDFVQTEYVLFLNNDTEVIAPTWLTDLMRWMGDANVGVVGSLLLYANNMIQHAGVGIYPNVAYHLHQGELYSDTTTFTTAEDVLAVTAACALTRTALYKEVGGMDAVHLKVNFNDVDFCLKVRKAGYTIILEPKSLLFHYESYSRGPAWTSIAKYKEFKSEYLFFWKKWGSYVKKYCLT